MSLVRSQSELSPLGHDHAEPTPALPEDLLLSIMQAADAKDLAVAGAAAALAWLGATDATLVWLDGSFADPAARPWITIAAEARDRRALIQEKVEQRAGLAVSAAHPLFAERICVAALALLMPAAAWSLPQTSVRFAYLCRLLQAKVASVKGAERLRHSVLRLEQAERLQRALFAIADQASADREMPEVLQSLHYIVGTLMYAENFFIVLFDEQNDTARFLYFVDSVDPDPPDLDRDIPMADLHGSLTWHLLARGKPLMGSPAALEAEVGSSLAKFGPDCIDLLGVPLVRGSQVVGGIVVQSYTESARFSEKDRTLLTYVAQHILTALERRRAHQELERRVSERTDALRDANRVLQRQVLERQRGERLQAALFRIAELANASESLEEFYAAVHRVVGGLLNARNFFIALLSDDQQELLFPYSVDEFDMKRAPRKLGKGLTEYVLRNGSALLADREDMDRLHAVGETAALGTRSLCWLGVPLVCGDRPAGVLVVQSYSEEHRYTTRDQELLTFVSYHIANALDRKRSAESLRHANLELELRVAERTAELATANRDLRDQIAVRERVERQLKHETLHDALTGLPNRNLLLDRLGQALDSYNRDRRKLFAVLFLDLDRFKVINDSVGHLFGDELLNEAGSLIAGCLNPRDLVARLGGDEFAIVLGSIEGVADACDFAQRIIDVLNAPIRLGGKEVYTSASIGIAIAAPRYRRAEELLRDADVAMYRAKADGRHRYAVFDERLHQEAIQLLELEGDLRRALSRNEFQPYYQPIVRLNDRAVVGYEALLRWNHPDRGVLAPADFLTVAEDNGSSESMDWQIFAQVCTVAPRLAGASGCVSINLSGRHFRSALLAERMLALLAEHCVRPECMRIEVTERALLEDPPAVKKTLETLRVAGMSVALDDFGTGYSSLSYLHQYRLQALKIDRSFVADLAEDPAASSVAVVRAILALAGSLGVQVIAEGIETEPQWRILREMGCEFGQGFLFGHPQPAATWI